MAMLLDQGFEQMDVPPERRTTVASRLPSLVGTAHAATLAAQQIRPAAANTRTAAAWTIQVGSFGSERAAREAASSARRAADGGEVRIEPASQHGRTIWRAQVTGLTAAEAQGACAALARHRSACMVLRPDQRQVASRQHVAVMPPCSAKPTRGAGCQPGPLTRHSRSRVPADAVSSRLVRGRLYRSPPKPGAPCR